MSSLPANWWECRYCGKFNRPSVKVCRCGRSTTFPAPGMFAPCDNERDLHDEIEKELRKLGWYYVHSRMDTPSTNQVGCPDFIIAAPRGRTIWIECKAAKRKLRPEQDAARAMLQHWGHTWYLIQSIEEFKQTINQLKP